MGFNEGQIIFNSEHGVYYPGQVVLGKLVFDQQKHKTFRGIYVEIKGYCKNHWTSQRRVGKSNHTVHHRAYEEYFYRKIYMIGGESGDCQIDPGHYEFKFEWRLPETCPSSFEHKNGRITYQAKAVVDRAFKFDQKKKAVFTVIAPYDLNMVPAARSAIEMQFENTYCCWCIGSGTAETIVKVPVSGFCPGQRIPIELACRNDSNVKIDTMRFKLKRYLHFRTTENPDSRKVTYEVAEIKKGPVPRRSERSWAFEMDVPPMDVYNLERCNFIDVDFRFKVSVETSGCHKDHDKSHSIFIGSIPLRAVQGSTDPKSQQPAENPQFHDNTFPPPIINQPLTFYPTNSPYRVSPAPPPYPPNQDNSPYPGRVSPVPPYPSSGRSSPTPYPAVSPYGSGLKTGSLGFTVPEQETAIPLLPPGGAVPYRPTASSPFASAPPE